MCNVEQSQVLFVVPSGKLDSITSETGLPVADYLSKHSGHREAGKKHLQPELSSTVLSYGLSHSQGNLLS